MRSGNSKAQLQAKDALALAAFRMQARANQAAQQGTMNRQANAWWQAEPWTQTELRAAQEQGAAIRAAAQRANEERPAVEMVHDTTPIVVPPAPPPPPPTLPLMNFKLNYAAVPSNCGISMLCEFTYGHKVRTEMDAPAPLTREQWLAQLAGVCVHPTCMFTDVARQKGYNFSAEKLADFFEKENCIVTRAPTKYGTTYVVVLTNDLFNEIYRFKDEAKYIGPGHRIKAANW